MSKRTPPTRSKRLIKAVHPAPAGMAAWFRNEELKVLDKRPVVVLAVVNYGGDDEIVPFVPNDAGIDDATAIEAFVECTGEGDEDPTYEEAVETEPPPDCDECGHEPENHSSGRTTHCLVRGCDCSAYTVPAGS